MAKLIVVVRGTGATGGSVSRKLLQEGWRVRVLTRDTTNDKAKALEAEGAELFTQADYDSAERLAAAFKVSQVLLQCTHCRKTKLSQAKSHSWYYAQASLIVNCLGCQCHLCRYESLHEILRARPERHGGVGVRAAYQHRHRCQQGLDTRTFHYARHARRREALRDQCSPHGRRLRKIPFDDDSVKRNHSSSQPILQSKNKASDWVKAELPELAKKTTFLWLGIFPSNFWTYPMTKPAMLVSCHNPSLLPPHSEN